MDELLSTKLVPPPGVVVGDRDATDIVHESGARDGLSCSVAEPELPCRCARQCRNSRGMAASEPALEVSNGAESFVDGVTVGVAREFGIGITGQSPLAVDAKARYLRGTCGVGRRACWCAMIADISLDRRCPPLGRHISGT
jgi:hypothetical protein